MTTVSQLIDKLLTMPGEAEIVIGTEFNEGRHHFQKRGGLDQVSRLTRAEDRPDRVLLLAKDAR